MLPGFSIKRIFTSKYKDNWIETDEYKSEYFPLELKLKVGETVMLVKNIYHGQGEDKELYCSNGTIGTFEKVSKDNCIVVKTSNDTLYIPQVKIESFRFVTEQDESGKIVVKSEPFSEWTGYPIVSANAVTIHKCQGQTIDKGIIELEDWNACHSVYVALSRFRSINDFVLSRELRFDDIHLATESLDFNESLKNT